ncbi:MAG TPA: hypothetical protein PLK12_12625 [Prolixibacteraceae bacterium]|nr:hypothetical protein [Prolixibacteraceae bacterium]
MTICPPKKVIVWKNDSGITLSAIRFFYLRGMAAKRKKAGIPLQVVKLEEDNYHILIETVMGNGDRCKWVVDTGASKTVFDFNRKEHFTELPEMLTEIQSAGISEGPIDTRVGMLCPLIFAGHSIESMIVALIDLSHINKLYDRYTQESIAGLIGSDFLIKYDAVIDFSQKKLFLNL